MKTVEIDLNGKHFEASVEPRCSLADLIREQAGLTGTHLGCEHGVCGSCTVLLDEQPVRSCITLALSVEGANVRTIEGFDDDETMQRLRAAFSEAHGLQCGFCTSGMLISCRDLVLRCPDASREELRRGLGGNICRCTGYAGIIDALELALTKDRP
jgi:carbon-monoxide dehydrogenase small subunit